MKLKTPTESLYLSKLLFFIASGSYNNIDELKQDFIYHIKDLFMYRYDERLLKKVWLKNQYRINKISI